MEKVLVDTHRSGVIELGAEAFRYGCLVFDFYPEHARFKFVDVWSYPIEPYSHSKSMKKRRMEFSKTDEFRTVPIENTDDNWWREKFRTEKKNPAGRKQLMVQYTADKQDELNPTKPHLWAGFHRYEDSYYTKLEKTWKTDKKVKRQWMKHKNKKVNNTGVQSVYDFTNFIKIYKGFLKEDGFGFRDAIFETPTFELIYAEDIEEELNARNKI